jgi:S-DNA-T family DNA segregation ATPase FtsK/SpoIIIE
MDPQVLVDAFRDGKLIGKDETLRLVQRAARVGDGWAITIDLPATRKAADVIKHRDALASALAVDEVQLIVERVRGKGGHAGRVFLWVADEDPYAGPPLRTPLLDVEWWDAWRPVPFGRDARGRRIDLPLVWTSLLVGAIPRQGKTSAMRLPAAGLILDPYARIYVSDGKGGKDWMAAEQVAYRFVCGDEVDMPKRCATTWSSWSRTCKPGSRGWPRWMTRSALSRRSPPRSRVIRTWGCRSPPWSSMSSRYSWKTQHPNGSGGRRPRSGSTSPTC